LQSGYIEDDPTQFDTSIFTAKRPIDSSIVTQSFGSSAIYGIAFGNGIYVAVGDDGKIATSPDGIAWTQQTPFSANNLRDIAFGGGLFVAVGENGTVLSSPDGITWTARFGGFGTTLLLAARYLNGIFFVGGSAALLATSPDGVNWTQQTTVSGTANVNDFAYNGSLYAYVGSSQVLETSPDGVTWTARTSNATGLINTIASNGKLFVYGGNTGVAGFSSDGITWTRIFGAFSPDNISDMTYSDDLFVAITSEPGIYYSHDGENWTESTTVATSIQRSVIINDGYILSVGQDSGGNSEMVSYESLTFAGSTEAYAENGENQYIRIT